MIKFCRRAIATVLCFIAFRRFLHKEYKDAIRLFEKASKYGADDDVERISYAYLGRSYVAIAKYDDALNAIEKAYKMYHEQEAINEDRFQNQEFKELLHAYSYALQKLGHFDRAVEIDKEAKREITIH